MQFIHGYHRNQTTFGTLQRTYGQKMHLYCIAKVWRGEVIAYTERKTTKTPLTATILKKHGNKLPQKTYATATTTPYSKALPKVPFNSAFISSLLGKTKVKLLVAGLSIV